MERTELWMYFLSQKNRSGGEETEILKTLHIYLWFCKNKMFEYFKEVLIYLVFLLSAIYLFKIVFNFVGFFKTKVLMNALRDV